MAYTDEEKKAFATRLEAVKEGLTKKGIKYYVPAAKALDEKAKGKRLNNVMNGSSQHEPSLALLERVAGIVEPVAA